MQLIPAEGRNTQNYWCSWRNQRLFMANPFLHMRLFDKKTHEALQRDMLSDEFLFGTPGVVAHYMHSIRRDMYIMLDDGWDLPFLGDYTSVGSLHLNPDRFPYGGATPAENIRILSQKIGDLGYAGTGLWVPMQAECETWENRYDIDRFRDFWTERAKWMDYAGIAYLKVDWGIHQHHLPYRALLTELVHKYAPNTKVEHAVLDGWFFDPTADRTRLAELMRISDAFRCYDVKFEFNSASSLGRAATMLTLGCVPEQGCDGYVNVGEEPYLAAALGCTMGIMSHPLLRGCVSMMLPDDFKNGITHRSLLKSDFHSFDHYERALRWQRLGPAMRYCTGDTVTSEAWLEDSWTYDKEPYPYNVGELEGKSVRQTAPQIVARNVALPRIVRTGAYQEKTYEPFVVASKNSESGVFTVATLARTVDGVLNCTVPEADIVCSGLSSDKCFAVFGEYRTLTLEFDAPIVGKRLFGGDILLDDQPDITDLDGVSIEGNRLILSGNVIHRLGTAAASFHDLADPGCVFCFA